MTAHELLADLRRRGVRLACDSSGDLSYRARKGVLAHDLVAALREHKDGILGLLASSRNGGPGDSTDLIRETREARAQTQ